MPPAPSPVDVDAWVRFPETAVRVHGRAIAWTARAVQIEFELRAESPGCGRLPSPGAERRASGLPDADEPLCGLFLGQLRCLSRFEVYAPPLSGQASSLFKSSVAGAPCGLNRSPGLTTELRRCFGRSAERQ